MFELEDGGRKIPLHPRDVPTALGEGALRLRPARAPGRELEELPRDPGNVWSRATLDPGAPQFSLGNTTGTPTDNTAHCSLMAERCGGKLDSFVMTKRGATLMGKLLCALSLVLCLAAPAYAQDWGIEDYLKNLPEKFKTFEGDYAAPSKETTVIDEKNGYAGYLKAPGGTDMSFEMALFRSKNAPPLVVVSNERSDMQCSSYETFFLRRVGNRWVEVKDEVLPPLDLGMFWDDPRAAGRLAKIVTAPPASAFRFEPPRRGTQMKVGLEVCDYFDEDPPEATLKEFNRLKETARPIRLAWDSHGGKFKLVRR